MKLVIHPPVDDARLEKIRAAAGLMRVVNASDAPTACAEIVEADAFFGKLTPELLQAARRLRWVQAPTASLEHYMFPELIAHSCHLSNMRGLFSDVIADHVMGFVICLARNFPQYIRQQMQRSWNPAGGEAARSDFRGGPGEITPLDRAHRHLADCTLGMVGVGEIGGEIARRTAAFGMTVCGVDPVRAALPGVIAEIWRPARLPDLLANSDFVVVAAPHTPETYKLFRREQFRQMRPTACFINIGRGGVVDLADLTAALAAGEIAGAGLDVFEIEPLPADHPLWAMPNVIITPHVAGNSPRIAERHLETLLDNIRRFISGREPATLVDKPRWC